MKTILLSFIFLFGSSSSTPAQTLYGTTSTGGELGGGTVYKIRPSVSNELEIVNLLKRLNLKPFTQTLSRQVLIILILTPIAMMRMLQIHPGELELCNGIDDDCDGQVDEGLSLTYYKDVDNDGYGDAANPIEACTRPDGYVDNDKDCNDANASIHPGGKEICNGIDDNCDRIVNEGLNKIFYKDSDNDGFGDHAKPVEACSNPDGYVDNDKDCNDATPAIYPGAKEICNGIDEDCDGLIDEEFADFDGDRIPDCIDTDDDNDGVPDLSDCDPLDKKKDKVLICHKRQ
ncbi:MAG: MopE-related protein [Bacteroidota bacterium]